MGKEKITITKRKAKGVLADMIANMDKNSLAKTREEMEKNLIEDYCSYEISRLLKDKGFDIEVGGMYVDKDNNFVHASIAPLKVKDYEKVFDDQFIPTCTHQMAMKWLREVHELFVDISFVKDEDQEEKLFWYYAIFELSYDNAAHYNNADEFTTYEKAVDAALKFSLEYLI